MMFNEQAAAVVKAISAPLRDVVWDTGYRYVCCQKIGSCPFFTFYML